MYDRNFINRAGRMRWIILALSCFIMFGNYYAFDNPSALNRQLRAWMPHTSNAEFEYRLSSLYTIYSAPNIFLPFLVGRALDRLGSRSFLIALSILVCAGQLIFALGATVKSWPWMMIGRLIFGLGGESLAVAQSRLVTEWFLGRELGLAIGLNLSIARIGTVVNNNISPRIAHDRLGAGGGVPGACWAGLISCLFSFACTLACIYLDALYRPVEQISAAEDLEDKAAAAAVNTPLTKYIKLFGGGSLATNSSFIHPSFYLIVLLNFTSYGAVLCFNNVASAYLQERYFPAQLLKANLAMSIPDSTAIFLVPLIGWIVDRSGFKLATIAVGQGTLMLGHWLLSVGLHPESPIFPLLLLGVGYSTLLALWSCVPFLAGSRKQATSYGFLTASSNFSVTVLPTAVAAFINADASFAAAGAFFAALGALGCLLCGAVWWLNGKWSLGLNCAKFPAHLRGFYGVDDSEANSGSKLIGVADGLEEDDAENNQNFANRHSFPTRPEEGKPTPIRAFRRNQVTLLV
jgi:nitrate/nitrite transporter NarK